MSEGASHSEQILEAARRNNTELLLQIRAELGDDAALAKLVNSTHEVITNNTPLHLGCRSGSWEFIDIVLDVEGVEIDSVNRDGETPLHLAVKYANDEAEHGLFIVDNLLDAGADPRIRDSHKLKPVDYVTDNAKMKQALQSAEYAISLEGQVDEEEDDDGPASDSD